jgi:hypothetical protein
MSIFLYGLGKVSLPPLGDQAIVAFFEKQYAIQFT